MIKILYIEDDITHVELTNRSLESSEIGFDLQTAATIKEAVLLLKSNEYDVILSDYRLPDGSGMDIIRIALEQNTFAAIVLITNQENINVAISALKAGAVDYVVKQSDYLHKLPIVLNNAYKHSQLEKQKKALNEVENKYRNIFENAIDGIFQSTLDGHFISVNPAMSQIFGYSSPDDMLKSVTDISKQIHISSESRKKFLEKLNTEGFVEYFEAPNLHKDGSIIWTSTNARAVKDKLGNTIYIEGFLKDITKRKQAELARLESENKYKSLVERVPGVVFLDDFYNNEINQYISPRIKDVLGYTSEEWTMGNKLWENGLHPDDRERVLTEDKHTDKTGEPFQVEYRLRRKDGEYVWIKEDAYLIRDQTGAPLFWQGILLDITKQKQADKILERQLKELTILHASSVASAQSNNEDEIIEQITRITANIYSEVCGVLLLNEQKDTLTPHASYYGADIKVWKNGYPITEGITGKAVKTGKSILINDVSKETNYIEIASEIKSELCVPFWVHDRIIGVFNVESRQTNAFDEEDERLLNTIASGLGTAIEKLRLFEAEQAQRQRETAMLNLIRAAASSLDLNQVLQSILDQLVKVIPSDSGTIQLLERDHLNILAAIGNEAINFAKHGPIIFSEYALNYYVITEKKTVRVDNCSLDDRYIYFNAGDNIKSFLGIPLIVKDKTIGMITLDSYETGHFTEQDEELGLALANQASIAIENARLFDAEQNRRKQAEFLRIATEELTTTIEMDKLFEIIFDSLAKLVPYDSASIETKRQGHYEIVAGRNILTDLIGKIYTTNPEKWELHQPMLISDVQADSRFKKFAGSEYIRSWMGIPLFSQGKLLGCINLDSKTPGFFNEEHVALAQTFANQAGIAIENARLFQEESRRSQIIEALANIANEIATIQEVLPALDKIAERTLSLLNASSVAIYLLQDDKQTIKIVSACGEYQKELISHTIKLGEGITGNVIANGKPEIVDEVANDSRKVTIPGTPEEKDSGGDTMMSSPLILHGETIGAINVWRLKANGLFDKSELNFLVSIAHQACISIESVRLFAETTRRAQEAAAIAEVGRDISTTLQLDLVLERIAAYAKDLLKAETSAIYLPVSGTPFLQAISAIGVDSSEVKNDPLETGIGILGNIALQKFGEIINDTVGDLRTITIKGTKADPYGHVMGVPVLSKDQLTGLLVVWRSGIDNKFQATELEFLSSLAQQAAVAIENARLFELEHRRRKEAEILSKATSALANTFNINNLFENILDWLNKIAQYDSASIMLNQENAIKLVAKRNISSQFNIGQIFPMTDKWKDVIAGRKPFILKDAQLDPRFEKWNGSEYIHGWMSIAMFMQDKLIGFINLDSKIIDAYTEEQATLVQTFANQAATAIENARLFEDERQRRREADNLRLAATAITSSLDPKIVLETILTALQQVVPFDTGTMMLLEDEYVKIVAAQGFDSNSESIINRTFPAANKLLAVINQTKKPYLLNDVVGDVRFEKWASEYLIRAWMGIPLIAHDKIIGYITLDSLKVGAFDQNAATLAHTFALHATAAIENTQLFENLQRSNQELSLAYDTTLAGWAKALELRDKETHGHTNRVTDLTMELARFIGLSKADLVHLRRGVLLHDIGKMGVPDEILHKAGPLTDEEWVEMRKHPQYAFDLLYPILFLRPSLDIPYSHHEWWDGTGYPQKLKGEEIPLPARIFAIVDVWDALLSDRPYRKAWTKAKVAKYLREQSESHFDPEVVEIFLTMMDSRIEEKTKVDKQKTQPKKTNGQEKK